MRRSGKSLDGSQKLEYSLCKSRNEKRQRKSDPIHDICQDRLGPPLRHFLERFIKLS